MRALRKLRKNKELAEAISDEISDAISDDDQVEFNANPLNNFALLQTEQSDEESDQSDQEEYLPLSDVSSLPLKSLDRVSDARSACETDDWEKILLDFKNDQPLLTRQQEEISIKQILGILPQFLDPQLELKRMFGSVAIEAKAKQKGRRRVPVKDGTLAKFRDTWPRLNKLGLSMDVIKTDKDEKIYAFSHSKFYQDIQIQFYQAVQTHSPNALAQLLQMFPYHIDSLLQLSEVCRMNGDSEMSIQFIERSLFAFEKAFHPTFQFATCSCRLDFDRPENRPFFLTVFRQIQIVSRQGCWRTALEWCKLLLGLDVDNDSYAAMMMLDFYALKSSQYEWINQFWDHFYESKKLDQFPNWVFSHALANFELEISRGDDHEKSTEMLINAILTYPSMVPQIFEQASVTDDVSNGFFQMQESTSKLEVLVKLFMENHASLWKMVDALTWLRNSVQIAQNLVFEKTNLSSGSNIRSILLLEEIPLNILRFIILSDALRGTVSHMIPRQLHAYDPLPPTTSIGSVYDSFFESQRNMNPLANSTFLSGLLRSLLPWTTTDNLPDAFENIPHNVNRQQVDAALIAAQNAFPEYFPAGENGAAQDWIQSLRTALMDLIEDASDNENQNDENSP